MTPREGLVRQRWVRGSFWTLLMAAIPAALVLALPTGYREDFNGCSTQQDESKREACCEEVADDCHTQCDALHREEKLGPGGYLVCGWDCDDANEECGKGSKIPRRVDWPGQPAVQIPGVAYDDNRIVAEDGMDLTISSRSIVLEVRRSENERTAAPCLAVVATCECPEKDQEYGVAQGTCGPAVSSGVVECRRDPADEGTPSCNACVPAITSVRPCGDAETTR